MVGLHMMGLTVIYPYMPLPQSRKSKGLAVAVQHFNLPAWCLSKPGPVVVQGFWSTCQHVNQDSRRPCVRDTY